MALKLVHKVLNSSSHDIAGIEVIGGRRSKIEGRGVKQEGREKKGEGRDDQVLTRERGVSS